MPNKNNKVTRYKFDDLILDVQRGELFRQGEVITLPKLSYDLLVALVEASPALLSQTELMNLVWPDRVIGDETLKQRIKLLRKSLNDDANEPCYIEAVRGRGYRLIPNVTCECVIKRSPSVMLDLSANDLFPDLLATQTDKIWYRLSLLGIAFFCVFIGVLLAGQWASQPTKSISSTTEHLNETLLKTFGQEAYNAYQQGKAYYQRYRQHDNDIAISFYLTALKHAPNFSLAYAGLSQAYSQQQYQFEGSAFIKQQAIDNAYMAISFDNTSADAYKALGTAYYVAGWLSKSVNALLRAYEIAPQDKEILTNLAFVLSEQGKFEQAFKWHSKALHVAPNYAPAMMHLSVSLKRIGELALAEKWLKKSIAQKPDYLLSTYHLAQLYIKQHKHEQARELLNNALMFYPEHSLLLTGLADSLYISKERNSAYQHYAEISHHNVNIFTLKARVMSVLLSRNNDQFALEKLAEELTELHLLGDEKPDVSLYLSYVYSQLGEDKKAIRYLVQASAQGLSISTLNEDINIVASIISQAPYQLIKAKQADEIRLLLQKSTMKKIIEKW